VPVSHQDHRRIPVTPAVSLGRSHQPFDFGFREVLAGAQLAVREPLGGNCSFYGGRRDQLEVRLGHGFRSHRAADCPDNNPSSNSRLPGLMPSGCDFRGLGKRKSAQVISGCLGLIARGEKGAVVSPQEPNPGLDVAGVSQIAVDRELGTQKGGA